MTENERVARLEQQVKNIDTKLESLETKLDKIWSDRNVIKGAGIMLSILWTISTVALSLLAARGH